MARRGGDNHVALPLRDVPLRAFLKTLVRALSDDSVFDLAAQLSYYFLFALFPLLTAVVTLAAWLPLEGAMREMLARLAAVMPAPALHIIERQLRVLLEQPRPKLLTVGLLVALWSASRGVDAVRKALNHAYRVTEHRSYVRVQLLALFATVITSVLVLVSAAMVVVSGRTGEWLAGHIGLAVEFARVWDWLRWPLTALIVTLAAALNYYLLPDLKQRFRLLTPGSVSATLLWLLCGWGFAQYVARFHNFNVAYGSLGGAIVLLTWLYVSGLSLLVGGEVNAVLTREALQGKKVDAGQAPETAGQPANPGAAKSASGARRPRLGWLGRLRRSPV
jgi:membrane protein